MKTKITVLLVTMLAMGGNLLAQNPTAVSGTITDASLVPYFPATVTACLTPVTTDPIVNGQHVNQQIGRNYCAPLANTTQTGFFTLSLFPNSAITPGGTQWQFTVTAAGAAPPAGKGSQTFQVNITISGTSQDVGATLTAASLALLNAGSSVSPAAISGNANAIYASPACPKPSSGNCYFVNADGQYVTDAVYSNVTTNCSGTTVPVGTCVTSATANFKSSDVGKIEYITTGQVWQGNGTVDTQGTIVQVINSTAIQISVAHATGGVGGNLAWCSDDTANLQAAAAQLNTTSSTAPNTLVLPAGGMMCFQQMPFKFTAIHAYELSIVGQGPNTVLMPTPNFDGTTCASIGCVFQDTNGGLGSPINTNDYLANFTVFGMGQQLTAGLVNGNLDNKAIISMPPLSIVSNVNLVGWGWNYKNGSTPFIGINQTSYSTLTGSIVNGAGNANWNGGAPLAVAANMPVVIGNFFGIAKIQPCVVIGYARFEGNACYATNLNPNNIAMYLQGGNISSTADTFNGIIYGDTNGYGYFDAPVIIATTTNGAFWNAGANFFLKHAKNLTTSGGGASIKQTSGTFTNEGGNIFGNGFSITGGTYMANQNSLKGTCTGVATAASTLGLYNTGPNVTLTTCTSTNIGTGISTQGTHTLQNLIVSATAAGTNASSGVVTVLVNGGASAITCTIGTSTSCQDGVHTVSLVDGDRVSIQFTTQAADTLAGVKAFVEWN